MRNPPAAEIFNEEVSNLIKRKIRERPYTLHALGGRFEYEGEVEAGEADAILSRISALHARVLAAAVHAQTDERKAALAVFAENLSKAFYEFEPDFFLQNVTRIVDDVVSTIHGSLEIWPTLVEICYFQKHRNELPQIRVDNRRARNGHGPARGALRP